MEKPFLLTCLSPLLATLPFEQVQSSPSSFEENLYEQMGDTASLQHSTILNAVIGDRPIRPKMTTILTPLIETFSILENDFSALEGILEEKLSYALPLRALREDYISMQGLMRSFLTTMFHGNNEDIAQAITSVYAVSQNGLLEKIGTFFDKLRSLEETVTSEDSLTSLASLTDKEVTLRYVLSQTQKETESMYNSLRDVEALLISIKDNPNLGGAKDLATRLDELEQQVKAIAQFLSPQKTKKGE